ncbi:MAG: DNA recombination protein RmuC [Verrucomicrobiota bacterium]|jgi:DNA recombination protein RmuC
MPVGIQWIIAGLIGAGLGFLFGWFKGRSRSVVPDSRLENELRQQVGQRETELTRLRTQLAETGNARASAEASRAASEKMLVEQRALQDKALADLRETFKALSADALKQSAPEFLRLAEQTFGKLQETAKGDLAQRQEAIKGLVEPLKQQLESYQRRLQQSETTQADALGKVKEQLATLATSSQSLAAETAQFRSVLKSNQARGRWGEETLRRVVEAAGMSAHCDFVEQSKGDEGKPDLIVKLPRERVIIVDSKVPDLDILSAPDAAEPSKRAEELASHAAKLRTTIKALSERDYPKQFPNALDHVVLFLPAESLFSTALEGDPNLIVWAESKQVYLATPASFIAVLQTINFIWQQHAQTENAQKIAQAAQELYIRVAKFIEHFEKIGAGLERANSAFRDAVSSYQSRVRPAGERLVELGGGAAGKELADVQPLDATLRLPPKTQE